MVLSRGSALLVAACATWFYLTLATAGFACLNNPCVYGVCMDDLNSSYTCYCINGYTGVHCQTDWDECWSSPCRNGGSCHDGVAQFNCTCPEGFVGELCEVNVNECGSNPCHNNGSCIDVANGYNCQCQPGYSGLHCETDAAVCNATEEVRCANGGLCVEGPGISFTCLCTSGWIGKVCDKPTDECASSPCQNGAVCVDLHASYACACLFGYTGRHCDIELELCDANPCQNDALCLTEEDMSVCYCVPDYHGDRCQLQYDECQLDQQPRCRNGGLCIDGVDNYTCSCPPELTGRHCECLVLSDGELDCTYVRPFFTSELPFSYSIPPQFITSQVPITLSPMTADSTEYYQTTLTGETQSQDLEPRTEYFAPFSRHATTIITTLPIEPQSETASSEVPLSLPHSVTTIESPTSPDSKTSIFTEGLSISHKITTLEIGLPTIEFTAEWEKTDVTSMHELQTPDTTGHEWTADFESTEISIAVRTDVLPESLPTTLEVSDFPTFDIVEFSSEKSAAPTLYETQDTISPQEPTDVATYMDTTDTDLATTSTREQPPSYPDCIKVPCLNGGTCFLSKEGPKCACQFPWSGVICEEHGGVMVAAFTGQSYLSHRLTDTASQGVVIRVDARTLAPTGLLFYARTGSNTYMALYLHGGHLRFQFSCGLQTMLLSELRYIVNNGFHFNIIAMLEMVSGLTPSLQCLASLRINNTLAMSGEQTAVGGTEHGHKIDEVSQLHLGGIPMHLIHTIDLPVKSGLIGCMLNLQIDGKEIQIYEEALDGSEVSECSSLACLSNPCHGSSTCVENGDNWNCLCPSGYVGHTCNQSVCANNPCIYGGTCVQFAAGGFICLCPFGKHGIYCEHDLEIGQPLFTSSTSGLSSYTAYPLPGAIHHSFELRFRFIPTTLDQIALLLFIGQDHQHDSTSDHLALSFIKGYIVLTWNLGSGPRRIFTPHPMGGKPRRPHTVRLGRSGQQAWLQVDNLGNVTGRSPGRMSQLNTRPILYIGGHERHNFSGLPHDLPLHSGFSGCVWDLELRGGRVSLGLGGRGGLGSGVTVGRGVGQCGTAQCNNFTCQHGGACIDHGSSFTCLCVDGWFGPLCSSRYNLCDSTRHNCSDGATCVPLTDSYQCDCSLGRSGIYCDKEEELSDVSFTGRRSFLSLPPAELHLHQMCLDFELRPVAERGLVVFNGQPNARTFLSLSLQGGVLELRLQPLGGSKRGGNAVVVRSGRVLALGVWHRVRAGRYGRRLFLWVDGTINAGTLLPGETLLPTDTPLYLGGLPDLSTLPSGAVAGLPRPYAGCVRRLSVNWRPISIDLHNIGSARNVADCDGTACGGDVCQHGGSCWLDNGLRAHCNCLQQYTGRYCETQVSCLEVGCTNHGRCVDNTKSGPRCHCPLGWTGPFCSEVVSLGSPHFGGDSYLLVDGGHGPSKRAQPSWAHTPHQIDFLFLNFSTAQTHGMILWSAQDDNEYVGIGVESGLVKVVWSWVGGAEPNSVLLPGGNMADGAWHHIALSITATNNITLSTDHLVQQVHTTADSARPLRTNGLFFLGGFPESKSVSNRTHSFFSSQFSGCIREFSWSHQAGITDFTEFTGENIDSCDLFDL